MNKDIINKMIDDDRALESIMADAMHRVGKEHDDKLMADMNGMDEEAFRRELAKSKLQIRRKPVILRLVNSTAFRAAAACIVCVLVICGTEYLPFSATKSSGYASMFNQYYTEYTVATTTFDAAGDTRNQLGAKSTAQLIQDASELLSKKSRKSTRRAIEILERLLAQDWRKTSLDPEIHWYLGLAYLKDGQAANAKEQFKIVKNTGKAHAADAAALLNDLDHKRKQ